MVSLNCSLKTRGVSKLINRYLLSTYCVQELCEVLKMWKMGGYIENELQMFEGPSETAEIGKLTETSGQLRQRKMTVNTSLCKWRKKKDLFRERCIFCN